MTRGRCPECQVRNDDKQHMSWCSRGEGVCGIWKKRFVDGRIGFKEFEDGLDLILAGKTPVGLAPPPPPPPPLNGQA